MLLVYKLHLRTECHLDLVERSQNFTWYLERDFWTPLSLYSKWQVGSCCWFKISYEDLNVIWTLWRDLIRIQHTDKEISRLRFRYARNDKFDRITSPYLDFNTKCHLDLVERSQDFTWYLQRDFSTSLKLRLLLSIKIHFNLSNTRNDKLDRIASSYLDFNNEMSSRPCGEISFKFIFL